MKEERRTFLRKFRRWLVIQKITLSRGYIDVQNLFIGVIFTSSIKSWFPQYFTTWWSFALLVLAAMVFLYLVGWIDRKLRIINVEAQIGTEWNPFMVNMDKKISDGIK